MINDPLDKGGKTNYGITQKFLGAYKKMASNQGIMRIEKANEVVREVFEMTGLMQML